MLHQKFKDQLKQGHHYELEALKYFEYTSYIQAHGNVKGYDLILDGTTKLEVKSEILASLTGNMAIEYEYKGNPSGVNCSECNFWVHFVVKKDGTHDCYIFPIDKLKELVKNCRQVVGGDGYNSKMYLLPVSKCQEFKTYKLNKECRV